MLNVLMTAVIGLLAWMTVSIIDLKTDTAVIAVKVAANHKMLEHLWNDSLGEKNANFAWTTRKPNIQSPDERS
tara:strand:+ start:172 stop:390 length:219 start_codon:yes stop_codon:yes gene_type:complete